MFRKLLYPVRSFFLILFLIDLHVWTLLHLFLSFLFWSCHLSLWDVSSQTRDWTHAPAVEAWSLNGWTARKSHSTFSCQYLPVLSCLCLPSKHMGKIPNSELIPVQLLQVCLDCWLSSVKTPGFQQPRWLSILLRKSVFSLVHSLLFSKVTISNLLDSLKITFARTTLHQWPWLLHRGINPHKICFELAIPPPQPSPPSTHTH